VPLERLPSYTALLYLRLSQLEQLEVLHLKVYDKWPESQPNDIVFPKLHTLDILIHLPNIASVALDMISRDWKLPSLLSLLLDGSGQYPLNTLVQLLETHGRHITTFHLRYGPIDHALRHMSTYCSMTAELSVTMCPLHPASLDNLTQALPLHLRGIRLFGRISPTASEQLIDHMRFILNMKMPKFRWIQLMDFPYPFAHVMSPTIPPNWLPGAWVEWADKLSADGVQFLDQYGDQIDRSNVSFDEVEN
jgi:hypothetical protein